MNPAERFLGGLTANLAGWSAVPGATPEPGPGVDTLDPNAVTPGVLGFLVIFAVVLACIPLFLSMTGKLRRVEHRARTEASGESGLEPTTTPGTGPDTAPGTTPGTAPRSAAPRTGADGTAAQDVPGE